MTTADAANHHVRMKRGSLILLANRAPPLELRQSAATRQLHTHAAAATLTPAQRNVLTAWVQQQTHAQAQAGVDPWHNVGVFIQSRTDWPRHNQAAANAGRPLHEQYTFNGRLRRCFVYDPSYINEAPPPPPPHPPRGRVSADLHARGDSRLRHHLFHSNTLDLLRKHFGGRDSPGHPPRAAWVMDDPSATVGIGGGGNVDPLDECRTMVVTWAEQVAWLLQQLNTSVELFRNAQTAATCDAWRQADDEVNAFFAPYTRLRLT